MFRAALPARANRDELTLREDFSGTGIRAILLDIEGTTTPVDFVFQTLFPYARRHARAFLEEHREDPGVRGLLDQLAGEHSRAAAGDSGVPPWEDRPAPASAAGFLCWLMERDSKITPLKALQGKIWEEGYRRGDLEGQMYGDVGPALARWHRQGKRLAIFSSGSVLAQQLIFAHSTAGDLTAYLEAYFDTATGPKREAASYLAIAKALALEPREILFVSDVPAELDAARAAGLGTAHSERPGIAPVASGMHPAIRTFAELFPES